MGANSARLVERSALSLRLIEPNGLPHVWEAIAPLVARGCEYSQGHYTPQAVVDGMLDGSLHMLAMQDGGAITSVMVVAVGELRTGERVFDCLIVGGEDMRAWLPFEQQMDDYARSAGCSRVRMIGRKGLAKMLPHWRMTGIVLEREVNGPTVT